MSNGKQAAENKNLVTQNLESNGRKVDNVFRYERVSFVKGLCPVETDSVFFDNFAANEACYGQVKNTICVW